MFIQPRFRFLHAVAWSFKIIPTVGFWAAALTATHVYLGLEWVQLPAMLVAVVGTAVSFYLGFKGNAANERLWEARKIWGGIVNTSRTWGIHVKGMVSELHRERPSEMPVAELHRELIYRHVAWLAALRTQLRRPQPWEHAKPFDDRFRRMWNTLDYSQDRLRGRIAPFVSEPEADGLMAQKNQATQVVRIQAERLKDLRDDNLIDDFRHMQLAAVLEELYTLQGKCERIKNFPLPRQYASANHWFVTMFIALLPLGLLGAFHIDGLPEVFVWLTVPASIVVGWMFYVWDQVLEYTENPFEGLANDIPMDALSRTIEIDLREMLGETDLPEPVAPQTGHALF